MDVVSQFRKRMLLVVVGCLGLAALLSVAVVLSGSVSGTAAKVIASAFMIPLACLFALAGATVREGVPALGVATILANAVAALALQGALWTGDANSALGQLAVGLGSLAIYGALVSLVVSRSPPTDTSGVRVAQALAFAGLGTLTLVVAQLEPVLPRAVPRRAEARGSRRDRRHPRRARHAARAGSRTAARRRAPRNARGRGVRRSTSLIGDARIVAVSTGARA